MSVEFDEGEGVANKQGRNNNKMSREKIDSPSRKTEVICCGVLERMQFGWFKLEDGSRCMPYILGHSDKIMYRVNNCPSCGKYVRDVIIEP